MDSCMDLKDLQEFYSPSSSSHVHPLDVGAEEWDIAEREVHEILSMLQPTVSYERKRKEVIEYIQILAGASFGIKVFPFGSMPLKTCLPHGDIDLTALGHYDEVSLSHILLVLLESEQKKNTQIRVRDVKLIPAKVKVVKCYVEDISVDISFNQMTGLCALSFLEKVDQLIGKDHLFKRSVILIKAWCFYESRTLGAHHGLISTYALETMIAHILNLFPSSLHSPLAVLYKFLTYYNEFDWDKYCLAINGVVLVSSLPEVVVQLPDGADDMLLSSEFLQECKEAYSFSTGVNQNEESSFSLKPMNIVDPLRDNNNLGRSVGRANLNRIKIALSLGTRTLNSIFALPLKEVSEGIKGFFITTLGCLRSAMFGRDISLPPHFVRERLEVSEKHSENKNVLAGIEYGLWLHNFGVFQGCDDPMLLKKWNESGLAGRYNPIALFQANELSTTARDFANSRGTGTFIPEVYYKERMPNRRPEGRIYYIPEVHEEEMVYVQEDDDISINVDDYIINTGTPDLASEEITGGKNFSSMRVDSPPPVDLSINIIEADEKNTVLENAEKMTLVENPNPPVTGDMTEFPDLSGLRLGDPNEFPPLQRDSGHK